jgi:hypothetical protein
LRNNLFFSTAWLVKIISITDGLEIDSNFVCFDNVWYIFKIMITFKKASIQFLSIVSCIILGHFKCTWTMIHLTQNVSVVHCGADAIIVVAYIHGFVCDSLLLWFVLNKQDITKMQNARDKGSLLKDEDRGSIWPL